jgi:hypothetical protein
MKITNKKVKQYFELIFEKFKQYFKKDTSQIEDFSICQLCPEYEECHSSDDSLVECCDDSIYEEIFESVL